MPAVLAYSGSHLSACGRCGQVVSPDHGDLNKLIRPLTFCPVRLSIPPGGPSRSAGDRSVFPPDGVTTIVSIIIILLFPARPRRLAGGAPARGDLRGRGVAGRGRGGGRGERAAGDQVPLQETCALCRNALVLHAAGMFPPSLNLAGACPCSVLVFPDWKCAVLGTGLNGPLPDASCSPLNPAEQLLSRSFGPGAHPLAGSGPDGLVWA